MGLSDELQQQNSVHVYQNILQKLKHTVIFRNVPFDFEISSDVYGIKLSLAQSSINVGEFRTNFFFENQNANFTHVNEYSEILSYSTNG